MVLSSIFGKIITALGQTAGKPLTPAPIEVTTQAIPEPTVTPIAEKIESEPCELIPPAPAEKTPKPKKAIKSRTKRTQADNSIAVSMDSLPERKQKYLKNRAKGMSKRKSALKAGYSESVAKSVNTHIETPDVKAAFREAMQKHAPIEKVAQRVAEGLDAMETKFFQKDGLVMEEKEVISWSERRQSAELSAQMGDYYTPKTQANQGIINIIMPAEQVVIGLDAWADDPMEEKQLR